MFQKTILKKVADFLLIRQHFNGFDKILCSQAVGMIVNLKHRHRQGAYIKGIRIMENNKLVVGNIELTVSGQTELGEKSFLESHDLQHFVVGQLQLLMPNGETVSLKVEMVDGCEWETEELEEELV
jgi:hypothetical protein